MNRKTNNEPLLVGMISAAIASGITYFLYGTERGSDTRNKLRETAKDLKDKGREIKSNVIAESGMLYGEVKNSYKKMADLFDEHKSTLKNLEREDVSWLLERFKDRMSDVWEETRDDLEDVLEDAKTS